MQKGMTNALYSSTIGLQSSMCCDFFSGTVEKYNKEKLQLENGNAIVLLMLAFSAHINQLLASWEVNKQVYMKQFTKLFVLILRNCKLDGVRAESSTCQQFENFSFISLKFVVHFYSLIKIVFYFLLK